MVDNAMRRLCLEFAEAAIAHNTSVMKYCTSAAVRPSIPQLLDLARCLAVVALADQSKSTAIAMHTLGRRALLCCRYCKPNSIQVA